MEMANAVLAAVGLASLAGICAASATLGVVLVCQWRKWSPINITINVYHEDE